MRSNQLVIITGIVLTILLAGCAAKRPVPNAQVNFEVPSKLSIIKKDSLLRIISTKESKKETPGLAKELSSQLNKIGYFKVNNGANPRYVLNLDTFWDERCDNKQQTKYNVRFLKKVKKNKDGSGYEYLVKEHGKSYTASLIGAISIYEVKNMQPLVYFNVNAEDTVWVRSGSERQSKSPCNTRAARKKMTGEIITKINSLLSNEHRNVPVVFPSGGDGQVKHLLRSRKAKAAQERLKSILPPIQITALTPQLYEKWDEEAEQNGTPKRDMDEDLANYYLLFMAQEARGVSEQSAHTIHTGYIQIMLQADDKSLINAAADSMARLEETASRLGIRL
ncbi:hypothetical protein [Desulfovibrio sp. JC022]|uniref:hypothetical protein n=1 Tax=Desulfovibrio sp. JC022 TaxID=2593642 RepID=UPI0013D01651|nr:hypothetical protein [Desulfovibrio sp. JC022]NDV22603.1 hypothetical protein [Desulfovibrio sp. JC022]